MGANFSIVQRLHLLISDVNRDVESRAIAQA